MHFIPECERLLSANLLTMALSSVTKALIDIPLLNILSYRVQLNVGGRREQSLCVEQ